MTGHEMTLAEIGLWGAAGNTALVIVAWVLNRLRPNVSTYRPPPG